MKTKFMAALVLLLSGYVFGRASSPAAMASAAQPALGPRLRDAHLHRRRRQARERQRALPRSHAPHFREAQHEERRLLDAARGADGRDHADLHPRASQPRGGPEELGCLRADPEWQKAKAESKRRDGSWRRRNRSSSTRPTTRRSSSASRAGRPCRLLPGRPRGRRLPRVVAPRPTCRCVSRGSGSRSRGYLSAR